MKTKHHPILSASVNQRAGLATLVVALLALSLSPVQAVCSHWDVSGKWNIEQENPTAKVELDLTQTGKEVTGTAKYNGAPGKVKGTMVGGDINIEIHVANQKHVFRGEVGTGGAAGVNTAPGASAPTIWYSTTPMKCVEAPPATTGEAPESAGSESTVAPATPEAPAAAAKGKIWANPHYPTVAAGQTEGSAMLTWNAGPDHAQAEVWLKIDEEEEKLVVKQSKGSQQVKVKPNKVYLYILKDSGEQIDSVTVVAVN